MLFPTITFAVFFTGIFAFAWALRERNDARKIMLLIASYVFYGWWDWRFCFLLLAASLVAWIAGLGLDRLKATRSRKIVVAVSVAILLGILGFFKYYGFFLDSLQEVLFTLGWQRDLPFMAIVLPVGISFFTFQAISYIIDIYRGHVAARRSPLDVLLYISLFPQLVAGPIVRAADFLPQLEHKASLDQKAVALGLTMIITGLFKKMVVANQLATSLVDPVFLDPSAHSSLVLMIAVYGYAVQIYCDFSGYTDIAIGTAALLGFTFRDNFNQPYRATSLQDFWRRWHMSLSQWLRDYLYIPLGGSRHGTFQTYRNLFLTMFLGGLWHGAAWNFVIWGSLHGGWLALERAVGAAKSGAKSAPAALIGWFVTFHVVCASWVFFRAQDFATAMSWFSGAFAFTGGWGEVTVLSVLMIGAVLFFQFTPEYGTKRLAMRLSALPLIVLGMLFIAALLATLWIAPPGTAPFIYFQF